MAQNGSMKEWEEDFFQSSIEENLIKILKFSLLNHSATAAIAAKYYTKFALMNVRSFGNTNNYRKIKIIII